MSPIGPGGARGRYSTEASLPAPRRNSAHIVYSASAAGEEQVFVYGGFGPDGKATATIFQRYPDNDAQGRGGQWESQGEMGRTEDGVFVKTPIAGAAAQKGTHLAESRNLIRLWGGVDGEGNLRANCLDNVQGEWVDGPANPYQAAGMAEAHIEDPNSSYGGTTYLFGGMGADGVPTAKACKIADDGTAPVMIADLPEPRAFAAACVLPNGKIAIIGGEDAEPRANVWVYDPETDTYEVKDDLGEARTGACAFHRTTGNEVIVQGGFTANWAGPQAAALGYNVNSGRSTAKAPMNTPRGYCACAELAKGQLVIGGAASGAWSFTPSNAVEKFQ